VLAGMTQINMFFENSTRTQASLSNWPANGWGRM
jgi:aspartate carbamoyltransferase catalytic subunit